MKNTVYKIETYLPVFKGFYGSIFEYYNEEDDIQCYNEENDTDLSYEDFKFDHAEYQTRVAYKCTEIIERELSYLFPSITIAFEKLVSPKYYNYSNDSINVNMYLLKEDIENIILYIAVRYLKEFKTYLKENYTSCSGFISSYSNDSNIWLNEYLKLDNNDHINHCLGSVLNFILLNEGITENTLYDNLDGEGSYINFEPVI